MLVSSLIFATLGPINAVIDWYKIEKKNKWINHTLETLILALIVMGGSLLATLFVEPKVVLSGLVTLPGSYWILHDATLNKMRGLPLDYLGSNKEKSAKTDLFLGKMETKHGISQWDIKFILLLLLVFLGLMFY